MEKEKAREIVQGAIKKLEVIPEDKWCTGQYSDGTGGCCAYGHYSGYEEFYEDHRGEIESLGKACSELGHARDGVDLVKANDGYHMGYPQATPKERSLQYLKDCLLEPVAA